MHAAVCQHLQAQGSHLQVPGDGALVREGAQARGGARGADGGLGAAGHGPQLRPARGAGRLGNLSWPGPAGDPLPHSASAALVLSAACTSALTCTAPGPWCVALMTCLGCRVGCTARASSSVRACAASPTLPTGPAAPPRQRTAPAGHLHVRVALLALVCAPPQRAERVRQLIVACSSGRTCQRWRRLRPAQRWQQPSGPRPSCAPCCARPRRLQSPLLLCRLCWGPRRPRALAVGVGPAEPRLSPGGRTQRPTRRRLPTRAHHVTW